MRHGRVPGDIWAVSDGFQGDWSSDSPYIRARQLQPDLGESELSRAAAANSLAMFQLLIYQRRLTTSRELVDLDPALIQGISPEQVGVDRDVVHFCSERERHGDLLADVGFDVDGGCELFIQVQRGTAVVVVGRTGGVEVGPDAGGAESKDGGGIEEDGEREELGLLVPSIFVR